MKRISIIFYAAAAAGLMFSAVACDNDSDSAGSSTELYFFQETFSFNVTSNPEIQIPVVRLGTSGDITVEVTSSGSNMFTVPSSVTLKDGERIGNLVVTYDKSKLEYNVEYELNLSISGYSSVYGYGKAVATIEYPTSFYEYGKGTIDEGWWGETENKTMYAREYAQDVLQCYLPDCWGHDTGPSYEVQDYYFYWNTKTNKIYVPLQKMGTDDWSIADRGTLACKFGGPDYKEGSADWMAYADNWYKEAGLQQPYHDPAKNAFYLSDTAAVSPETGAVVYGTPGTFDVLRLE
ncbi:MAG: hypothetical protein ACI3ZO_00310 [Candidatus Cryptobacteroides sp.]|nr:hypothetical protein [Bacteroidales bacterium]